MNSPHTGLGRALAVRLRRAAAVAMMTLALAGGGSGCYGKFPLTRAIHKINGEITDYKLVHSIVFWIFIILPVYDLAFLVDAVIFNLIEFWTDETLDLVSVELDDGSRVTLTPGEERNTAVLTVECSDGTSRECRFVRISPDRMNVLDENGAVVGCMMRSADGGIRLCDAQGRTVSRLAPDDVAALAKVAGAR
ncbi:MAG: hypothetical protein Kow0059_18450 [Candidatus Sumerlaeia bacterium]